MKLNICSVCGKVLENNNKVECSCCNSTKCTQCAKLSNNYCPCCGNITKETTKTNSALKN